MNAQKLYAVLMALFGVLGFAGAVYVLWTRGEANAGFACVPMLLCLIFSLLYQKKRGPQEQDKRDDP